MPQYLMELLDVLPGPDNIILVALVGDDRLQIEVMTRELAQKAAMDPVELAHLLLRPWEEWPENLYRIVGQTIGDFYLKLKQALRGYGHQNN